MGSCCRPKEVCVIGAGMSGLAAARELRREGHAVTVMEQSGDVGGQWQYDPRTDGDDPLGAKAPVKVHSSMYASVRVISPRECMGFSDFQFVPRPGAGRDARRYPGHREVYRYLKDFCEAFGLADAIRLNTKVVRVAMEEGGVKWKVTSVHVEAAGEEGVEEVFAPWFFEAQARWIALLLSGKVALPPEEDMLRAVHEDYRAREMAGVPTHLTHAIPAVDRGECWEFVYRHSDLPRMEDWKKEMFIAGIRNSMEDRDTFRT